MPAYNRSVCTFVAGHIQKVVKSRVAIPCRLDVQLALGPTKPGNGQNRGHGRPRHFLASFGHELLKQHIEFEQPPQSERQPHIAERSQALHANATQFDPYRFVSADVIVRLDIEQGWRWRRFAVEPTAELSPTVFFAGFELAQVGDDALPRSFGCAIGFDEGKVRMHLTVLPSLEASEKHRDPPRE